MSFLPSLLIGISYSGVYLFLINSKFFFVFLSVELIIKEHKALDPSVSNATHMWETIGNMNLAARLSAIKTACGQQK